MAPQGRRGRTPDDAEREVLSDLGDPMRVSAAYSGRRAPPNRSDALPGLRPAAAAAAVDRRTDRRRGRRRGLRGVRCRPVERRDGRYRCSLLRRRAGRLLGHRRLRSHRSSRGSAAIGHVDVEPRRPARAPESSDLARTARSARSQDSPSSSGSCCGSPATRSRSTPVARRSRSSIPALSEFWIPYLVAVLLASIGPGDREVPEGSLDRAARSRQHRPEPGVRRPRHLARGHRPADQPGVRRDHHRSTRWLRWSMACPR